MVRLAASIILLIAFSTQAFDAKLFLPFESGSNGDTVDATYMNANDFGTPPANWTLTGSAGFVTNLISLPLFVPAFVESTNYYGGGTRCLAIGRDSEQEYATQFASGERTNAVVFSGWFWTTTEEAGNYDIIVLAASGGQSATVQINNGNIITHTDEAPGSGEVISVDTTKPHFISTVWRLGGGEMEIYLWDTNGVNVGYSSHPISDPGAGIGVRFISFGNCNPHGDFETGHLFFDSVSIWWGPMNMLKYPVGQFTRRYVATGGNNSNAGTNWGTAWATIDAGWDRATNSDSLVIVSNGIYSSAISSSTSGTPGSKVYITALNPGTVTNTVNIVNTGISNVVITEIALKGAGSGADDRNVSFVSGWHMEFWHCFFTNAFDFDVFSDGGQYINAGIFMGNTFAGNTNYGDGKFALRGTNNLVSHNKMPVVAEDYILGSGQTNVVRNNHGDRPKPLPVDDGSAHVDFIQFGSGVDPGKNNNYWLIQDNFYRDADVASDHHHLSNASTSDADPYSHSLWRRNIAHQIGTAVHSYFATGSGRWTNVYLVNESYLQSSRHSTEVNTTSAVRIDDGARIKNCIAVDLWGENVTLPVVWNLNQGYSNEFNLKYDTTGTVTFQSPAGDEPNGLENQNPLFVDYANDDFRLQSGSPARNAGGPLAFVTSSSGSGTSVTVDDPGYFWQDMPGLAQYNGELMVSDTITIGTDVVTITTMSGSTINFTPSITFAQGDGVYWGSDTTPDMGSLPFGHTPLASVSISQSGTTHTAVVTGDYGWVVWFVDGVPLKVCRVGQALTFDTVGDVDVVARAYAQYAHDGEPWVSSADAPEAPGALYRNKGKATRLIGVVP